MELLAAIDSRSSAARVGEPGPTPEHLARILEAAAHAPDHGRLRPWRFIVVDAGSRDAFAVAAARAKKLKLPSMSEEQFTAECEKMRNSPAIVVVGCSVRRDHKVPEIEQVIAAAAAAQNMFLAAHDLGYGVMWKTGAAAYDPGVKAAVGLDAEDHIIAIMHLGTRLK